MAKRRIAVLGSTGSIGTQTLDVVRQHGDKLEIVGLAVNSSLDVLLAQAREFGVRHLAVGNAALANDPRCDEARALVRSLAVPEGQEDAEASFGVGSEAVVALTQLPEVDVVVNALVGAAGLEASYATLKAGKVLALANKESLVVGGDLIMPLAAAVDADRRASGVAPATGPAGALMPIDSEHGAIYQCLLGENPREVSKLWVTASGGPFRGKTIADLEAVTPAQARDALRSDRGGSAAPECHPFDGGVYRWVGSGSFGYDRYAHSHSICSLLSRAVGGSRETARFSDVGLAGICGARCGYVPLSFSGSSCR